MAAIRLDISLGEGDTETLVFGPPITIDGVETDLTGYTGAFQIRENASDYGAPLFEASTALGNFSIVTIGSPGVSSIAVLVEPEDTTYIALYSTKDELAYALVVIDENDIQQTIYTGTCVFTRSPVRNVGFYPPAPPEVPLCGTSETYRKTYTAGENIIGYRGVRVNNNLLYHCDADDISDEGECIGIAIQSADAGDTAVVVFGGEVYSSSWNWTPNPIFLGTNGVLSQTPSGTAAFAQQVATAISATKIIVDVKLAIILA